MSSSRCTDNVTFFDPNLTLVDSPVSNDQSDISSIHKSNIYHNVEVIVSCLDESYVSSEIFPAVFNICRKDRKADGGGVFLGVKDTLVCY